ncbi:MAG: ABC transporter substrate-binding protein [Lacibacter sp.]
MKKTAIFSILIALVAFSSCNYFNKKNDNSSFKVKLIEEWFPSACFAGDVVAINETAKENNIDLEVKPGADDIDPIKLVLGDVANFGVAGGDRVLTANNKGSDLVVLAAVNYKSPTCFIALKDAHVLTAKDFEGKKVGVMTGNNTEFVYRALLNKAGLDKRKIKEVEAPYDLATFITKAFDVRPAFAYDEPVSLDQQNIAYTIVKPEDYGVNFVGPVIFAKRSFVEKNKDLTQRFISSMAKGWEVALAKPDTAMKYLKEYDKNIDSSREFKSLLKGKEYFAGEDGKPLYLSKEKWSAFVNELVNLKLIPQSQNNYSCFDNSFVQNYFSNKK